MCQGVGWGDEAVLPGKVQASGRRQYLPPLPARLPLTSSPTSTLTLPPEAAIRRSCRRVHVDFVIMAANFLTYTFSCTFRHIHTVPRHHVNHFQDHGTGHLLRPEPDKTYPEC